MPVYEYKCDRCDVILEKVQKITDEPLKECSECGGPLRKLISSTSFVLKGNGWYVTDYPSKDRQHSMTSEKPAVSPATSCKKQCSETECKMNSESKADTATSASTTPDTAKCQTPAKESAGV
ncbi:MAG: zinc ribbon domain-containing protein [Nitrospirae bacterium]|nr:zinc ribbon domain-containing protein [Nitrospirota bacterium]